MLLQHLPSYAARVAAIILVSLTSLPAAPPEPLWSKAIQVASTNGGWVPGLTIIRSEVFFRAERVALHELWQRSKLDEKGEVMTEAIKVLEDGKEVTKKSKQEPKEPKDDSKSAMWKEGLNPFAQAVQPRIKLKVEELSRVIDGRNCVSYAFELKHTNGAVARGTAWLEAASGIPMEIEDMKLDPLPDKHLKSMTFTTRYESTNGVWRVKAMETTGTVSMFLIKAGFRSTTTFSEHWRKAPPE